MKKILLLVLVSCMFVSVSKSQIIGGTILADTNNVTVVQLWGNHYDRGWAYGFLLGHKINNLYVGYVKPTFGSNFNAARNIITQGQSITIDSIYIDEAQGVIDGMDAANVNINNCDYIDILIANSMLDLMGLLGMKEELSKMGCSSLISWGSATTGTDLNGKSVVSRHLDWYPNPLLVQNQVMVIHIPFEPAEQPWMLIGFAGQISALSGINNAGLSVYQHVLGDFNGSAVTGSGYEPIWITARKVLESADFNQDGVNNTEDFRDAVSGNVNGYAAGYILSCMGPAGGQTDSLTALVCELASQPPLITFRTNSYSDNIPDDNLYAANYSIKRNNAHNYCTRYNNVKNALGTGTGISSTQNWNIMKNYSVQSSTNLQFMQHIPELRIFKMSPRNSTLPAYLVTPVVFDLDLLFQIPYPGMDEMNLNKSLTFQINPNPVADNIILEIKAEGIRQLEARLYTMDGRIVANKQVRLNEKPGRIQLFDTKALKTGIYILSVENEGKVWNGKVIVR